MREYLLGLSAHVREQVGEALSKATSNRFGGVRRSPGGDAQFDVDDIAEGAVWDYVRAHDRPVAVFSEDHGLRTHGRSPEHVLVVDPIDGTRPAAAGLEMATISIAAAPISTDPTIDDIDHALLRELRTGAVLYWDKVAGGRIETAGYVGQVPCLSAETRLDRMFWTIEFNGHPAELMVETYGHLVDLSANTGGLFVFNSASYSLSRIITGQLDAYVDVGNRLLKERPQLRSRFESVGGGSVLHLFPYDIAASVVLAQQAGVTVTDAFGAPLGKTRLLDLSPQNQQSCIAAATPELHRALMQAMRW